MEIIAITSFLLCVSTVLILTVKICFKQKSKGKGLMMDEELMKKKIDSLRTTISDLSDGGLEYLSAMIHTEQVKRTAKKLDQWEIIKDGVHRNKHL